MGDFAEEVLKQDEANNVGDAGHHQGFLATYWLKNFHHKSGCYSLTVA